MSFTITLADASLQFPEFKFVKPLTPSAQKAAFHVQDTDGNDLCLKIISPNYGMDRLDREIQAMQAVSHCNVVSMLEYTYSSRPGSHRHFLVEEFIDGCDLTDHMGSPWDTQRAASVFGQLLDGLSALTKIRVVHRDIKPSNVRIRPNDSPVLIDFGLARHLNLSDLTDTVAGAQIGTATYFSPEQFTGNKYDIDNRTDLFAVGIMLLEALIGRHPFWTTGMTRAQLQNAVCEATDYENANEFQKLSKGWKILLRRLLAKDRAKRPHNAAQAASIIRKIEGI